MKSLKLHLYHIDMKFIRDLAKADDRVMSVSPQICKENRPFVGIIVVCDNKPYCVPLTSPKAKHQQMKNDKDFSKMVDKKGKIIGVLNFNNMIPISQNVITQIDIKIRPSDSQKDKMYKELLNDQLDWCNQNKDSIIKKANKLYKIVTETPDKFRNLNRRCCDFKKLEKVLLNYIQKKDKRDVYYLEITSQEQLESLEKSEIAFELNPQKTIAAVAKVDKEKALECLSKLDKPKLKR